MKTKESNPKSGIVSMRLVVFTAVVSLLPILLFAAGPQWWADRGLLNGNDANDYAPINQGQLKHLATTAFDELNANLPGGVGDMTPPDESGSNAGTGYKLTALINSWSTLQPDGSRIPVVGQNTNDYASINLGQLKNVTKLFYDRLIEAGYHQGPLVSGTYPWIGHTANDYAMANIGQVKNLFSFDVSSYVAPPVAQNADLSVANDTVIPLSITLLASGTSARPLTYTVLTSPGHGTLSGDAPNLTYMPALNYAGTDTLTFKANDGLHDSNTATVTILTKAPPRVYAGANQAISLSGSATLAGTVVDLDTPSAQLAYSWAKNSGPGSVTFANASALQTTATFSAAGSYQLTLVVSDGEFSRAGTTTVEVNASSATPPVVSLTSPATNSVVTKPFTVSLAATATASTGTIVKVEFYQGTQKLGESTAAPYTFNWQASYAGIYSLSAKATDSHGATAFSSPVIIKVINDGDSNDPPVNEPPSGPAPDPTNPDQDTDGDGVPDSQDDYPDDPNRTKDVPIQTYAAIDISGTAAGDNDVTMVALDDDNKAAFACKSDSDHLKVWTWNNGMASENQTVPLATTTSTINLDIPYGPCHVDQKMQWYAGGLLSSGKVYGLFIGTGLVSDAAGGKLGEGIAYLGFTCDGGKMSLTGRTITDTFLRGSADEIMSTLWNSPDNAGNLSWWEMSAYFIQGASPKGIYYGDDYGNGFLYSSSTETKFTPPNSPGIPTAANDNGWVIAGDNYAALWWAIDPIRWTFPPTEPHVVWNGSKIIPLPDNPAAINNAGQVIGGGFNAPFWVDGVQVSGTSEGYLWDSGTIAHIKSMLPDEFQKQIQNVTPKLISNSGTDAGGVVSYNILFSADSIEGPGTGTLVNHDFVVNVSSTGTNTFTQILLPHEISLPDGLQGLNSNGIGAALGTVTTTNGDGSTITSRKKPLPLLPVKLKDVKKVADQNDDVVIQPLPPKNQGESNNAYIERQLPDASIAYIEPHGATNNVDPEMPHLVAKLPGGPQGLKVKWRLQVEYKRGNGYRADYVQDFTRPEDTVLIPAAGQSGDPVFTAEMDATDEWRIFETTDWQNEINQRGFFGGTAKLYMWFPSQGQTAPTDPIITFRIGGKNPDQDKAKTFINGIAGQQFWYAYAIAKHETNGRVRQSGQIRYYNQFYTSYQGGPIGDDSIDMGWAGWAKAWPIYNLDRDSRHGPQNGPGGYGVFQLTLGPKHPNDSTADEKFITRKAIWNWQDNCRGAIQELQGKVTQSHNLFDGLQATYPASGSIPNYRHFSGLEAILITCYNGMGGGQIKGIQVNGFKKKQKSCWDPGQSSWKFLQNKNRYCESVNAQVE